MNLAFTYNIRHTKASKNLSAQEQAEFDSPETIKAISDVFSANNCHVFPVEADEEAYANFKKLKNDIKIVFNFSEGLRGQSREAQIPAMLEMLAIPYTHSGVLAHAVSLDKSLTKKVLRYHGIQTPNFQLVKSIEDRIDPELRYPLIVKPNAEGSSKGIFNENLVFDKTKLLARIKWLLNNFHQPVLVEEFLRGREFTVAVLGNNAPKVLPIVEQNYNIFPENMPHFASYEAKWLFEDDLPNPHDAYFCPAPVTPKLRAEIEDVCLKVWEAIDIKDVTRIDMRLDADGHPSILELNTIPGMISDPNIVSYLPIAARKAGMSFEALVMSILHEALVRYNLAEKSGKTFAFSAHHLALRKD